MTFATTLLLAVGCIEEKKGQPEGGSFATDSSGTGPFDTPTTETGERTTDDTGKLTCDDFELPSPEPVNAHPFCGSPKAPEPVLEPWDVEILWTWDGLAADPEVRHTLSAPVVAQLTDDDGDGRCDEADDPDVALVAFSGADAWSSDPSTMVILDGSTGAEIAHFGTFSSFAGVAAADLDGDGCSELVTFGGDRVVSWPMVVEIDGTTVWEGEPSERFSFMMVPLVADLLGDGGPEVIAGGVVYDAAGEWIGEADVDPYTAVLPLVADLDRNGTAEIHFSDGPYDPFTKRWPCIVPPCGHPHMAASVFQADDGPEGEILWAGAFTDEGFGLYGHDETERYWSSEPGFWRTSPSCAGDLDGDGSVETVLIDAAYVDEQIHVFGEDGAELWARSHEDVTQGAAGCAMADLDGDRLFEVLYAGSHHFWILDGRTGDVLFDDPDHRSDTVYETPIVADVDGDGSANVLYGSHDGAHTLTVLAHAGEGWAETTSIWPVHDYHGTNVLPRGFVPPPDDYWNDVRVHRGQPRPVDPLHDFRVDVLDSCVSLTGVSLAVQLANEGASAALAPSAIEVTVVPGGAFEIALEPGTLEPGAARVVQVDVDNGAPGTTVGFRVATEDCDHEDDEVTWVVP